MESLNKYKNREVMPKPALLSLFFSKKLLSIIGILLVVIVFLLPIYRLVFLSFTSEAGLTLQNYSSLLQNPNTWDVLTNTFLVVIDRKSVV